MKINYSGPGVGYLDTRYVNVTGDTMTGQLLIDLGSDTQGLIIQGAASQTANITEWQDSSGTVLGYVQSRGTYNSDLGIGNTSVTIIGHGAGNTSQSGNNNVLIGFEAGRSHTTAGNNVAIGKEALEKATEGDSNVAIGSLALRDTVTGRTNMAIGAQSLWKNTGTGNSGIGALTLYANVGGNNNTAIGLSALGKNVSGSNNVAIGGDSGEEVLGNANVMIGFEAGKQETGSQTLYISNSNTTTPLIYGLFTGTGAGLTIHSQATDGVPLTVKGIASQSANLQEWQDSSGNVLQAITAGGGRIKNTTRQTTTYTATVNDHMIYADTDGGAWTLTLPAGVEGQEFRIVNCGSSANDLTIDGDGAETVMGATTQTLSDGEIMILIYNSTEGWW